MLQAAVSLDFVPVGGTERDILWGRSGIDSAGDRSVCLAMPANWRCADRLGRCGGSGGTGVSHAQADSECAADDRADWHPGLAPVRLAAARRLTVQPTMPER